MGILEYVLMAMFFSALLSFLAAYRDMDFSISDAIIASAFWPLSLLLR